MMELVVLVDEDDKPLGTKLKTDVHTVDTPLHRGFSLFVFNSKGQLLLTNRSKNKKTFPGVWTNTVCGHPRPGEKPADAAMRRLDEELKIMNYEVRGMKVVAPYRYRFADANGIVENEICPVIIAYTDKDPEPMKGEVDAWKWLDWQEVLADMQKNPKKYSPWSREEAELVERLCFNR